MDLTSHLIAFGISICNLAYSAFYNYNYESFIYASMTIVYTFPIYFIYKYKNENDFYKMIVFIISGVVLSYDAYYTNNIVRNILIMGISLINNRFEYYPEITWLSLYLVSMLIASDHTHHRLNVINHTWFIAFMTMYGGSDIRIYYKQSLKEHAFKHVAFGISNITHIILAHAFVPSLYECSLIVALALIFGASVYFHYYDKVQEHTNEIFANLVQILCYIQLKQVWYDKLSFVIVAEVIMNSIMIGLGMNKRKTDELNVLANRNNISRYMLPIFFNLFVTVFGVWNEYSMWVPITSWLLLFTFLIIKDIRFYPIH